MTILWRPIWNRFAVMAIAGAVFVLCAGFVVRTGYVKATSLPGDVISMPILVMGSHNGGAATSVEFKLQHAGSVDRLWFEMHSPGYSKDQWHKGSFQGYPNPKASIRVNGGSWVGITNENVTCASQEAAASCVEGPWWRPRFTVPVQSDWRLVDGTNTIEFRFDYEAPDLASGYRVLRFAALTASYSGDLGWQSVRNATMITSEFTWRDPADFVSDLQSLMGRSITSSDRTEGEVLWKSRNTLKSGPAEGGGFSNMPEFVAACADCHTNDGIDLKYFGYEPETIVVRAQHHGLSESDGQKIAAFVLSQQLQDSEGNFQEPPGRPWWAPYQPGATLAATREHPDMSDQFFWASGSDYIAESDEEMIRHVFSDGNGGIDYQSDGSLNWRHIQTDSTLNIREIPILFPLPDWNEWLPRVHPLDSHSSDFTLTESYQRWAGTGGHTSLLQHFQSSKRGVLDKQILDFWKAMQSGRIGKNCTSNADCGVRQPYFWEDAKYADLQWALVKLWEGFQLHHRQDELDEQYGTTEVRGWIGGNNRNVFDLGPHIHRGRTYGPDGSDFDAYLDMIWYYAQMIFDSGAKRTIGIKPVDWKYHLGHLGWTDSAMMFYVSFVKMMQNGSGLSGTTKYNQWNHTSPAWALSRKHDFEVIPASWASKLFEAMTRSWNEYLYGIPAEDWPRGYSNSTLTPEDETPTVKTNFTGGNARNDHDERGTQFYSWTYEVNRLRVSASAVDSMARWGEAMWPKGDWEQWMCEDCSVDGQDNNPGAVIRFTLVDANSNTDLFELVNGHQIILSDVSTDRLNVRADTDQQKVGSVLFGLDGDYAYRVDNSAPYSLAGDTNGNYQSWTLDHGTHQLSATTYADTDASGQEGSTLAITFSLIDSDSGEDWQDLNLVEGWNFISAYVKPIQPSFTDIFDDVLPHVILIKDALGRTFSPVFNISEIDAWEPPGAYIVYAHSASTVRFTGTRISPDSSSIFLDAGWNLIPYYPSEELPVSEALETVMSKLIIVKDDNGASFMPTFNIDDIGVLRPGLAYKVYLSEHAELRYPSDD